MTRPSSGAAAQDGQGGPAAAVPAAAAPEAAQATQPGDPAQPAQPAQPAPAPTGGGLVFTEGGKTIRIRDGQVIIERPGGQTETMQIREVIPSGAVDVVQALGATLVMIIVGFPLSRAFARWIDRRSSVPRVPRELTDRLQHMEQSLDQVAVEVERISEAQRFSAQLLAAEARQPETASRGSLP